MRSPPVKLVPPDLTSDRSSKAEAPLESEAQDNVPEPLVLSTWPLLPSALGKVQVVADDTTRAVITATARLKDGTIVSAECSAFRGSASNPMNRNERLEKILDCSHRNLSERDTERLLALLENLEDVSDICDIMEILRPAAPE